MVKVTSYRAFRYLPYMHERRLADGFNNNTFNLKFPVFFIYVYMWLGSSSHQPYSQSLLPDIFLLGLSETAEKEVCRHSHAVHPLQSRKSNSFPIRDTPTVED